MSLHDPHNTSENWQRVSNCELGKGAIVKARGSRYRITGFGPYFIWAIEEGDDRDPVFAERKLYNWTELEEESDDEE